MWRRLRADLSGPRVVLLIALGVAWLNFLLTTKWTFPGALNGPKRPWYAAALAMATIGAIVARRPGQPVRLPGLPILIAGGWTLLTLAFLTAFPPSTWQLVPFFDDWPPRFQSTVEGLTLLGRGAFAGWNWHFLGGYHTSADLTQNLTMLGAIPMTLLGDRLGFHLLHATMIFGIPLIVYLDVAADEPRDVARLTAFFAVVTAAGLFGTIIPSGDTNSIAGVFCAVLALGGSRAARLGRRWGGPLLALGLTLALYSHGAFFLYTVVYLALEAVFYRDHRMALRGVVAGGVAFLGALPLYWEMLRYPAFFLTNNLLYTSAPTDWAHVARQVFYNTEILLHPHRWFNDYLSLTKVFLVLFVWIAVHGGRSRPAFYAWAVLATTVLLRFDVLEAGFLLSREMHMMSAFAAPPLAWFIVQRSGHRLVAAALVAVIGMYVQIEFSRVPHVTSVREFDPALIDRLGTLDGHLVLIEGNPHRDLNADPVHRTERTPFGIHFEAMLPAKTGRSFYAQTWDAWHWTPFRGQTVAGGSFRGRVIGATPVPAFEAEMRKWGVRHLVVWSQATTTYLDAVPERFTRQWTAGRWIQYEMANADDRSVVTPHGHGRLASRDPLTGVVELAGAQRGDRVVVRTNYFPAWQATSSTGPVSLFTADGQLAFYAPADGSYSVALHYPRRGWLSVVSLLAFVIGLIALGTIVPPVAHRSSHLSRRDPVARSRDDSQGGGRCGSRSVRG